ncbi:hypothetical protein PG987_002476 [Apiospora arundinis]
MASPPSTRDYMQRLVDHRLECWFANATYVKNKNPGFLFDHSAGSGQHRHYPKVIYFSTEKSEWYLKLSLEYPTMNRMLILQLADPMTRQRLDDRRKNLNEILRRHPEMAGALDEEMNKDLNDLSFTGFFPDTNNMTRTEKIHHIAEWQLHCRDREDLWPTPPWKKSDETR